MIQFSNGSELRIRIFAAISVLALLAFLGGVSPAAAQQVDEGQRTDTVFEEGWERIGSFKGSTSSVLWQRVNDVLFEQQASGALYRDLGDVTLGLGYGTDNVEVDWDNSFYRRVLPLHRELPLGGLVTGEDLSRYIDLQTLISRGRMHINYIPGFAENLGGIGVRVEGGTSLTLGRIHHPLEIGDRPLAETLADPDGDLETIRRGPPEEGHRSLVRLGVEGVGGLIRWISGGIGRGMVDTEQSAIFFENYADPVTLFIDLEIPVEAALFTEGDTRLGPGDLVRHVTFLGLTPLAIGAKKYGIETNYSFYYRFFRETTIVKENDGHVVVQVKTALARGNELTPLKIRPAVRILGILRLGYTFFEQIFGNSHGPTYNIAYRIDLNDERGMACFKALLGEGTRVTMRPLAEAALQRTGAEVLRTEARQGKDRTSYHRTRFFRWFKRTDQRTASADIVTDDDGVRLEIVRSRNRYYQKKFGTRRKSHLQFLARSQSDMFSLEEGATLNDDIEPVHSEDREEVTAVTLLTSLRDDYASGGQIRRASGLLSRTLDWDRNPVLDELARVDRDLSTRFVLNLRLSFDGEHIMRMAGVTEDEVWTELAHILLGGGHRDAWSSEEKRKTWKRAVRKKRTSADEQPLFEDLELKGKPLSPPARYRLARREVNNFKHLQELALGGDSLGSLTKSFDSWSEISLTQALMVRLGRWDGGPEIGYHYEVFTDEMLRPVTETNGIVYEHPSQLGIIDAMDEALSVTKGKADGRSDLEKEQIRGGRLWKGDNFVEPSRSRLKGGDLLVNTGAIEEPGSPPPCWKLRLYSDLQYAVGLTVRIDLREDGGIKADRTLGFSGFVLGEPTAVEETPFMTARFYYDIPLPSLEVLEEGEEYVLLLRVLNPDGLPVSEEQQVRFRWPEGGLVEAAGCYSPPLAH